MQYHIDHAKAKEIIEKFPSRRIMVIGDLVADIYLNGTISRISREAPVLVLEQAGEKTVAGGAANVVNNVATLGGKGCVVGLIGDDKHGETLRKILEQNGAITTGLVTDDTRPTITKTRIIAGGRATVSQQIVRIDNESKTPISAATESKLLGGITELLPSAHGVIISDYGSGTVTPKLSSVVLEHCRGCNIPTMVDSRYDIARFAKADYVKQNEAELAAAMGVTVGGEDDLMAAAESLRQRLMAKGILVTRGEKGMTLVLENGRTDIPVSDKSEVFDVSGAGDTSVAAFVLAVATGENPAVAAALANVASGIAVRKLGTATVSGNELLRKFD